MVTRLGSKGLRAVGAAAIWVALVLAGAGTAVATGWFDEPEVGPGIRSVAIRIHYSAFEPDLIDVEPGQTIRFVIENADPIDHEFIVGDESVQLVHEEGTEAHHPARPGEVSVPAGETVTTTVTFPPTSRSLIFGCHLPGHYAYGMRGEIRVG